MDNILDIYTKIKNNEEVDTGRFKPEFIADCFRYKILKEKPSKSDIAWFESCYGAYPVCLSDITKSLEKELKEGIKMAKADEKYEEKMRRQRAKRGFSDSDCWDIYSWFLKIMPKMLNQMKKNICSYPTSTEYRFASHHAISATVTDKNATEEPELKSWKNTLDYMIFLLGEMNEETCSLKNPYEKEYQRINNDFYKKYGFGGEKLTTEEDIARGKEEHRFKFYTALDFPDLYPTAGEVREKYIQAENEKYEYIDECKEEFFKLFSEYFYCLWD